MGSIFLCHYIISQYPIIAKIYIEYVNDISILCANVQKKFAMEMDIIDEQIFMRFELKMNIFDEKLIVFWKRRIAACVCHTKLRVLYFDPNQFLVLSPAIPS